MFLLTQAPNGALSTKRCTIISSSPPQCHANHQSLFSKPKSKFLSSIPRRAPKFTLTNAADSSSSSATTKPSLSTPPPLEEAGFSGEERVPLEGVIQFDKRDFSAQLNKWGHVALLSGGDVLALFVFSAIGRFSHGFPVLDVETLHTADPFIAGWFLSAYFLGGYANDGRGMNGLNKAVVAAAKSWAVGIPLGIAIRAASSGHIPAAAFMVVTMGSTAVLLIGWRALLFTIIPNDKSKKSDVYRRGNPFELFEVRNFVSSLNWLSVLAAV